MFRGVLTALITPFLPEPKEKPAIDYDTWEKLIEWQISSGVSGLVIFGTTGESPTLDREEKVQLTKTTLEIVRKRVPVIAGTGTNCTYSSIQLTKELKALGADASLAVTPYYNRPTQEGLYQHFAAVAEEGGLPVIVYNVPGRTGADISNETVQRLAELKNIVAIKQAVDSISRLVDLTARVADKIDILAGDDPIVYSVMSMGGTGVISASASVIPEKMVAITKAAEEGRWQDSLKAQQDALPIIKAIFAETNPTPAKAALAILGIIPHETFRLPLVPVSQQTRDLLRRVLKGA